MGSLSHAIQGQKVYLDANIFIYALEGIEPWATCLAEVFASLEAGKWQAVTSSLSIAECLVKPFDLSREDLVQLYRTAFSPRPHLTIVPLREEILVSAARLRGLHKFKLPDALHISTALDQGCTSFMTNDAGFRRAPSIKCQLLSEWITA